MHKIRFPRSKFNILPKFYKKPVLGNVFVFAGSQNLLGNPEIFLAINNLPDMKQMVNCDILRITVFGQ